MFKRFGALVTMAVAACGGGDGPLPQPATLEVVAASDGQSAPAGATLANPLEVLVRADDGVVLGGAVVRWTIADGAGASLSDSVTLSDGTGRAIVALTLGPTPGEHQVRAALVVVPDKQVTLSATATAPPILTSVTPQAFEGGDTLTLTGETLGAGARVEIAGQTARTLSATVTGLTVIAPHCLVPGPVQIRAFVQGAPSNTLTATYVDTTGVLVLAVGEYVSVNPDRAAGCSTFPAAGPNGAEYVVTAQSVADSVGVTQAYVLRGDSVVDSMTASPRRAMPLPPAVRFHDFLRSEEAAAARRFRPGGPPPPLAGAAAGLNVVGVGDRRDFRVCNVLTCQQLDDFTQVRAQARWVGRRAAIFVDDQAPAGFTPEDLDSLGRLFDDDLYEVDTRAFGAESDADANGVVIILFTPVVNGLTPQSQCETSIITGFFFGIDLLPIFQDDPRSNKGEVFYAVTPDPDGTVTCRLGVDVVRRLVQVTFVHELQHMISFNQHVLQRNGEVEVLWLNEALSHLAEELAAFRFEARGDETRFTRFVIGDLFNAYLYLEEPGAFFVLPTAGTGSLEERGAGWLFLRWLVDRFGEGITRRLVETRRLGAENVEAVIGEPFGRLLAEWFLANWVSDLPNFSPQPRLTYTTWRFRTTYLSLNDQVPSRFPRPFPIVPTDFPGGRGLFSGTLRSGSGDYFRLTQEPSGPGFTVSFTQPGGTPLPGAAAPRLNVIRVR